MMRLYKFVECRLPKSNIADLVYSFPRFLYHQRYLPKPNDFSSALFAQRNSDYLSQEHVIATSDKLLVKAYARNKVGFDVAVPTLHFFESPAQALSFSANIKCIAKPTHMSGVVEYLEPGERLSNEFVSKTFNENFYFKSRERNYYYLRPGIIIEPLVFGEKEPLDFKVFCRNGSPKLIQVDFDRFTDHTRMLYDTSWSRLDASTKYKVSVRDAPRPPSLNNVLQLAAQLAKGFMHVRIDFYISGREFYLGEITHCHGGSFERVIPETRREMINELYFS